MFEKKDLFLNPPQPVPNPSFERMRKNEATVKDGTFQKTL